MHTFPNLFSCTVKEVGSLCTVFNVLLYDADTGLSSPIHKTEGSFSAEQGEEVPEQTKLKTKKSRARLARLAMLADTIKHWEDDLRHPTAVISPDVCICGT